MGLCRIVNLYLNSHRGVFRAPVHRDSGLEYPLGSHSLIASEEDQ